MFPLLIPHTQSVHVCRSLFSSGRIKPVIYTEVYPLEKLSDGLAALERRGTWGKAIIRIKDEYPAKL
jgi:NADPH:quinone reductase-like Zn-dependent oxidoreductase